MKKLAVLTILLFITVFITSAYAPDLMKFEVYVSVIALEEDETERETVESHLKRELRALGDVVIVGENDDWDWRILINVAGHTFKDGGKDTWASLAIAMQQRVPKFYFDNYNFRSIPVYNHSLTPAYWQKDGLHRLCVSIANRFDKKIQPLRLNK